MAWQLQGDDVSRFFSLIEIFSHATGLAALVVDARGNSLSEQHNFTSFCTLMRSHPYYRKRCRKCDEYCVREALKEKRIPILSCHAGLSLFLVRQYNKLRRNPPGLISEAPSGLGLLSASQK